MCPKSTNAPAIWTPSPTSGHDLGATVAQSWFVCVEVLWFSQPNGVMLSCNLDYGIAWLCAYVCDEVLRPSQPNGVTSSEFSLPNHTFTGQA